MSQLEFETIIFDLGFTLFVFENFSLKRYFQVLDKGLDAMVNFLNKKGIITNPVKFRKQFKRQRSQNFQRALQNFKESSSAETLIQTCAALNITGLDSRLIHEAVMVYHSTEGAFWKPRPNAKKILQRLKELNYNIALLSNAPYHGGIQFLLESNGLSNYFDVIATSAQIGFCKPDKRAFEFVLKRLKTPPQKTIMIGDDLKNDIYGAKQLGMKTIHIQKGFEIMPDKRISIEPDWTITDLSEILIILHHDNRN
ncbi:MAG: HAD family hydrolase [Candidatus Helarchaeota archaeon]